MLGMIRNVATTVLSSLASAVRLVASVIGGLILLHALFVFFEANPANGLVDFVAGVRDHLGGFTKDLFSPKDPKTAETVNAALAGLVWVVAGNVVARLVGRLAPGKATSKA